jgi:RNA polymerase sigma factor (sigma-70 family)
LWRHYCRHAGNHFKHSEREKAYGTAKTGTPVPFLTARDREGSENSELLRIQKVNEAFQAIWDVLDEREQLVVSLRFGLFDNEALTLSAAGEILGVSKERVRQIENRAIAKLGKQAKGLRIELPD